MDTQELKALLRPSHDAALDEAAQRQWRCWTKLRRSLYELEKPEETPAAWTSWLVTGGAIAAIVIALTVVSVAPTPGDGDEFYAHARQPDVYTATFYSNKAQADVVWITGLEAAQ